MMKGRYTIAMGALVTAMTLIGCEPADEPSPQTQDDVSVDEQMSPASENRPAGIGREDTTATPGTRPSGEQAEDQTEIRDRLPPDE